MSEKGSKVDHSSTIFMTTKSNLNIGTDFGRGSCFDLYISDLLLSANYLLAPVECRYL